MFCLSLDQELLFSIPENRDKRLAQYSGFPQMYSQGMPSYLFPCGAIAVPRDTIGVIGISTLGGPVRPDGNHLRWSFPARLGFPPKGFQVFRRPSQKPSDKSISFSGLLLNVDLPPDLRIDGVQFLTHPGGRRLRCRQSNQQRSLYITPANLAQLELRFPEPIVHLRLEFSGSGHGALRAFRDRTFLGEVLGGGTVRDLFCSGATRFIVELGSGQLKSVLFTTAAAACNARDWQLLKDLQLANVGDEALELLEAGLMNYYTPDLMSARTRYQEPASEIVTWQQRLLYPTADSFENPDDTPDRLKVRSQDKGPTTATYPQSLLLLAALDPNIARLMCLYWVDAYAPTFPALLAPPLQDQAYDYKIEAGWDGKLRCGLVLNLGQPSPPLPTLKPELTGKQLSGLRWVNGEMLGRIGLSWPKPTLGNSPQARAVQPVLYELTRTSTANGERTNELILINNQSWEAADPVLYVDRDVPGGPHTYSVAPIDLFGQLGVPLNSEKIEVADNVVPPPPIRTRSLLRQTDDPPSLTVQFEFGAAQLQQAPDIARFVPYWRPDSLFARRAINLVVTATVDGPGGLVHTLRMRNANLSAIPFAELETFVGDVITNVITGAEETLPANARRRFRIARAVAPDRVILEEAPHTIPNGTYELVRDPHNRTTWTPLSLEITWRDAVSGTLRAVERSVSVRVLRTQTIRPRPDPFALVPATSRPRNFPNLPPPEAVLEIEVDRLLTEPDVFAEGRATKSGFQPFKLIYVIACPSEGVTRIALPANAAVAEGDTLDLLPAVPMRDRVRRLSMSGVVAAGRLLTPGGEIAFETTVGETEVTSIMRVISSATNQPGGFDLVVRADEAASLALLQINQTRIRYFEPFVFKVDVSLSEPSATPITLPIPSTAGRRDGFIAISSVDHRNQEGPLGTPSQFSVLLTGPNGVPSKPYPCGLDVAAPAGYASPPNRAGRATICLTWDSGTLTPAEGVRYEVVRALDNAIVAAHLREWQAGRINNTFAPPLIAGSSIIGALENITLEQNGIIRATFASSSVDKPSSFRFGRLRKDNVTYQVTLALSAGTAIELLLRGPSDRLPSPGVAALEAPPDYSQAKESNVALQALALNLPDAFALVTGVPITVNEFTDDVAGQGRNRFFYRVRAVDAAENRSAWSPVSAPFYQVDTTPPAILSGFRVAAADRSARLLWEVPADDDLFGYEVYRRVGGPPNRRTPYRTLARTDVTQSPLVVVGGRLTLPASSITTAARIAEIQAYATATPLQNLFVKPGDLTRLEFPRVVNINPLAPESTPVEILLESSGTSLLLTRRPGSEELLTVQASSVDFSFGVSVSAIEGVFLSASVSDTSDLAILAAQRGFLSEPGVAALVSELRIDGLGSVLADGAAVAVIIRLVSGELRSLRYDPGGDGPLVVKDGRVKLNLELSGTDWTLRHVRLHSGDLPIDIPRPGFDLTEVSSIDVDPVTDRIVTLKTLNPLVKDGTPIGVRLVNLDDSVEAINGNPRELCWVDTEVVSSTKYHYSVSATRQVMMSPAAGSESTVTQIIVGQATAPVAVEIRDWSVPGAPRLSLTWVDAITNSPASAATTDLAVSIQTEFVSGSSQIKVERREPGDSSWSTPLLGETKGWHDLPNSGNQWRSFDRSAARDRIWEYRIRIRTLDNRLSPTSSIVRINPPV